MIRIDRRFGIRLSAACLAAIFAGLSAAGQADASGPAAIASPPPADAPQIEHYEYWRARGDAARAAVAEAKARLDEANGRVARMNRDNRPQGEPRVAIRREQAEARAAWEAAVHHLEVELPALVREAGGQARWVRDRS
jgi:hypothetical protein